MKRILLTFFLLLPLEAHSAPVISELLASNDSGLQDEDGDFPDWIELHNPDTSPVDLAGYILTDDPDDESAGWVFPEISLPAESHLVLYASGKDRRDPESNLHLDFRLNAGGETVTLFAPQREQSVDSVTYPPLAGGHSYALVESDGNLTHAISNTPTPGTVNATNVVLFSRKGQAFTDTIILELASPGGHPIRYTENGKPPSLFNGKEYSRPITIERTSMITASAGGGPFRTEVFIQVDPALADRTSDIPLVIADAFAVLNQTELKDMAFAIIEPASDDGRARLVSEFHLGTRGGIRTRGETSNSFPKKPLRLEFWGPDAEDRDLAPLGMPAGSDWILNARYTFDRTLMHNAWIFELSNQLGHWAPRTRFVELYLNDDADGLVTENDYQGIYTFMETIRRGEDRVPVDRMDAGATTEPDITGGYIFKKDKTDPGTWDFTGGSEPLQMVEPAEEERGERTAQVAWLTDYLNTVRDAIREHGPDPERGYPAFIEVDTWLDHHHLNFLPNNVDALRLSAYFHKPRGGTLAAGPIWDFDRSAGGPSDGRITDPLQWGDGAGGTAFFVRGAHGTPVWWEDLFATPDFLQAWLDRWYELRHSELVTPTWDPEATPLPAFSEANINRIFDHMAGEIMEAQERNFAKWSGAPPRPASQLSYSDVGGFPGEIEHIKGWLAARMAWIEDEFITVPSYEPQSQVHPGELTIEVSTGGTLFKPALVYYTTNGTDPRGPGGSPAGAALELAGDITLTQSARVIARRLDETYVADRWGPDLRWSGPANRYYFIDTVPADATNLVVSEIMYHPAGPSEAEAAASFDDQDDFEFLELLNISGGRVDLTDARLRGSADFDFADGTVLEPAERLVLVSNDAAFTMRYGRSVSAHGEYRDQLGNADGVVRLRDYQGNIFREFSYGDSTPWPEEADGEGMSLTLKSPASNPNPADAAQWTAEPTLNGTPGRGEPGSGGGGTGAPEALATWLTNQLTAEQLADDQIAGSSADADNDGLPTLAEFLVSGRILQPDPDRQPRLDLRNGFIELSYPASENAAALDVAVESSGDLIEWETVTGETLTGADRTTFSTPLEASTHFLRLRIALRQDN